MPYTFPWDATGPVNTVEDAVSISADIRVIKQGLNERLADVLIVDPTADPWVLKPAITGARTGLKLFIPFSAFQLVFSAGANHYINGGIVTDSYVDNSQYYFAPVPHLLGNCVIQQVSAYAKITIGGTAVVDLRYITIGLANGVWNSKVSLNCLFNGDGFYHQYDTAAGLNLTAGDVFYQFFISTPNIADRWQGILITYDRPSF